MSGGLRRALERVGLPTLALSVLAVTVVEAQRDGVLAIDFRSVSPEIRGLIHGTSPYVLENVWEGGHFLWTVPAGWMLSPFAWLPYGYLLVVAFQVVGLVLAAWLLGVRDGRLIAIAIAWPATVNSVQTANITMIVVVLLAAAWHDRRSARSGLWVGLAVVMKLFAWPALVWLAATRRWRALGVAAAVQVVGVLVTLPYVSLQEFVRYQREVDQFMAELSLTLNALTQDLGANATAGRVVALAVGLAILWFGRRDLGWVVVAMLVLSPVVWLHYYGLLLIPLALWSSSLLVWSLPLLLFVAPGQGNGETWQTAATLGVFALTVCAARWSRGGLPTLVADQPRV